MIPIGAIVGALVAARALSNSRGGQQTVSPYAAHTEYFLLSLCVFFPLIIGSLIAMIEGAWVGAPLLPIGLVLCFPWTTARWVLIPLGWPRMAYRFGSMAAASWGADRFGGRVLAAAWALLRDSKPSPDTLPWLQEELENKCAPLRGAAIVAHGLLAASRGDLETARALCRGVHLLDRRVAPRLARKIALEWSLADAAAHGRWRDVIDISQRGSGSYSLAAFFRASARRLLGEPRAGRFALVAWWVLARRWWATWPLLKRAWKVPPAPRSELELDSPGLLELDALGRALELHAALAQAPEGRETRAFVQATVAWDVALKSTHLQDLAAERAQGLRPGTSADAVDALRAEVEEELAAWALAHELPLDRLEPGNDLLESVAYRARNEVLERIESASDDISRRLSAREPLASEDEWRLFLSLQRQCALAATLGGHDARRLAFEAVNVPLCNLGAWLFNEQGEKAIANGMFRWLLDESLQVGSDEDQQRYKNNVGCGP